MYQFVGATDTGNGLVSSGSKPLAEPEVIHNVVNNNQTYLLFGISPLVCYNYTHLIN